MDQRYKGLIPLVVCAVAFATAFGVQWRSGQRLRAELEKARHQVREAQRLEAENARLRSGAVSDGELLRLRSDREALHRLKAELATIRASIETSRSADTLPPGLPESAEQWRNAGRDTPMAALETVLWAVKHGDVDTFASCIAFEPHERETVRALFPLLVPEALRAQHGSLERLVAERTLAGLPRGISQANVQISEQLESVRVAMGFSNPETRRAEVRDRVLSLRREPDGWRIIVPTRVVEAMLAPSGR